MPARPEIADEPRGRHVSIWMRKVTLRHARVGRSDHGDEKKRDARAAELVRVHSGASPSIMKLWPRAPVIDN